jgi:outer membrane protein assembly factor BamB
MVVFEELKWTWTFTGGGGFTPGAPIDYYGITLQSSNRTYTVTVQEEPVYPTAITSYPLPTEYWNRPIEGQNNHWGQISSNWLNSAMDRNYGSTNNRIQTQGSGPNSGHILWTKPTEDGGVVGGDWYPKEGDTFNAGHQYQTRMQDTSIIMHGRLYYQEPIAWSGGGGAWVCVDLKTGEEIWRNQTMAATPSFGYYYAFDDMNQHGIVNPGWLFSSNFGTAINPRYGTTYGTTPLGLTDVPAGTEVIGPKGEALRYRIQREGSTWRLYEWNSSRVFTSASTGSQNASLYRAVVPSTTYSANALPTWDFNVTLSTTMPANWNPTIRYAAYGDVLLCSNGTLPAAGTGSLSYHNVQESTLFAISLKPGEEGRILWTKNYQMTFDDGSQNIFVRAGEGAFVMQHMPDLKWSAYDIYTGNKLWEGAPQAEDNPFGYFSWVSLMNVYCSSIYDGKLFTTGYTGRVYCYDLYNGTLIWVNEAPTGGEIFVDYTLMHGVTADNKIYIGTHEHSADTPLLKGAKVRVYDVDTGEEIWSMIGWANPSTMALADGVLTYWNNYDHQVYAVGKGPSSTTVKATDIVQFGSSVMITGNVIDVSAGTKQEQQAARFPNGVPAVSDESQSAWMEYVYMQKPRPTNVTGVDVELSVIDANGNYRTIGTTTADADGFYSFNWVPDIEGKFTVYASFGGSESYWPSHAVTAFNVDPAPEAATPQPTQQPSMADQYFLPAIIGIIVAIIAVGLLTILTLKKHP